MVCPFFRPVSCDPLRSSYEQSSSGTGKQLHQELQAIPHYLQMLKSVATHVSDTVTLFGLTDPAAMSFVTHKHKYDI